MRRYGLPMLVLLVVFAGAVVYKWNAGHSRIAVGTVDDGNPEHALDKKTLAKALARNLLASNLAEQGAERRVTAQAPLQAADTQSLELLDPQKAPEPPESYSFTPYLGEMDEARFETRLNPPKRQVDSEGDAWLNDPEAAVTLVQQAREAEREWTFGYLRLVTHASADDIDTTLAPHRGSTRSAARGAARPVCSNDKLSTEAGQVQVAASVRF